MAATVQAIRIIRGGGETTPMAVSSKPSTHKKQVSPALVAGAVILLLVFIGWWAYHNFGPQPEPPKTRAMETWDEYMKKVAAYTGGDPGKLTKEDYDKIYKQTSGFGVASEVRKYAGKP